MGIDIYWNKTPLNGQVGDDEVDAVMKWSTLANFTDVDEMISSEAGSLKVEHEPDLRSPWSMAVSMALVYRVGEGLGHYFRASYQTWPSIVAEMKWRRMLGDGAIPAAKLDVRTANPEPVTPREIHKALDADDGNPILPMLTLGGDPDEVLPGLWVRWLCFMERAAEIGDGFTVS